MSEARPYKKPEREKALERDNAELEKELVEDKTEKTIIREEVISPPNTAKEEAPKKKQDEDKEDKETLDDVNKEDRYKASPGP